MPFQAYLTNCEYHPVTIYFVTELSDVNRADVLHKGTVNILFLSTTGLWRWRLYDRCQVVTAASIKMRAFCDVAPCSLDEVRRSFTRAYCLHDQGDPNDFALKNDPSTAVSKVSCYVSYGKDIFYTNQTSQCVTICIEYISASNSILWKVCFMLFLQSLYWVRFLQFAIHYRSPIGRQSGEIPISTVNVTSLYLSTKE
jgi:hypothetical protein